MTPLGACKTSWQTNKDQFIANPAQKTAELIQQTLSSALFIIACVGAAGSFPAHSMGWVVAGISGAMLIATIPSLKEKKCTSFLWVAISVISLTVGILGGAGVLSATQVGWGCIGVRLVSVPFACCCRIREMLRKKEEILATVSMAHQMRQNELLSRFGVKA